jgi:hypothetical protein
MGHPYFRVGSAWLYQRILDLGSIHVRIQFFKSLNSTQQTFTALAIGASKIAAMNSIVTNKLILGEQNEAM